MTNQLTSLLAAMDILPDGVLIVDRDQVIVGCNRGCEALFGYQHGELIDKPLAMLLPPELREAHVRKVASYDPAGGGQAMQDRPLLEGLSKSGKRIPVSIGISVIDSDDERFFIAVVRDARSFDDTLEEAISLADLDPLTQLGNRRYLSARLEALAASDDGAGIAMLFLDLDGFKRLNDEHGHEVGDEVLSIVAQRLERSLRGNDSCIRLGGDEFVVLVEGVTEARALETVAEKLCAAVTAPMRIGQKNLAVGLSMGGAIGSARCAARGTLMERADRAMYRAKRAGGGYCFDAGTRRAA
ncbi:MAG: diguanylate cyclase domain-containing protein [Gammaproteobacteria bacterium]